MKVEGAALAEGRIPWGTPFLRCSAKEHFVFRAYANLPTQGTVVHDAFVRLAYSYMNLCKSKKETGEVGELIVSCRSEGGLPDWLQ